jgi:hypothetical protein
MKIDFSSLFAYFLVRIIIHCLLCAKSKHEKIYFNSIKPQMKSWRNFQWLWKFICKFIDRKIKIRAKKNNKRRKFLIKQRFWQLLICFAFHCCSFWFRRERISKFLIFQHLKITSISYPIDLATTDYCKCTFYYFKTFKLIQQNKKLKKFIIFCFPFEQE